MPNPIIPSPVPLTPSTSSICPTCSSGPYQQHHDETHSTAQDTNNDSQNEHN